MFGEIGHNMEFDCHAYFEMIHKDNCYDYYQHLDNQFLSSDENPLE